MGAAMRFREAARAARVAVALRNAGYGVLWRPDAPEVIMTSASRAEAREVAKRNPGTLDDWYQRAEIDCGVGEGTAATPEAPQLEPAEFAHISLTRLCGCNYKQPVVKRTTRYVYIQRPQRPGTFRVDAAKFDAGKSQFRAEWSIRRWDAHAEEVCARERNWQD